MKLIVEHHGDLDFWILSGEGPVLMLNEEVFVGIEKALDLLEGRAGVILTSDRPDHFCAGADLDAIGAVQTAAEGTDLALRGQEIFRRIETAPVPIVAALPGTCLGGGMELALACHARIAAEGARMGLPEVRVGLLPGLGGTQRLPRLIGLKAALPLLLTGRTVDAKKARKMGLIDAMAPGNQLRREAERLVRKLPERPSRIGFFDRFPWIPKAFARRKIPSGFEAPRRVLRALGRGDAYEAKELGEAVVSGECRNLVEIFHAMSACKRDADDAPPQSVGVLGFGIMGAGIATALTKAGIFVRVRDVDDDALIKGLHRFRGHKDRLTVTTGWEGFLACDMVIEAVPEVMQLKQEVLSGAARAAPNAILMSNTSSLSVSQLGVVGLHFFNPVHRMPLVEVVAGPRTPPAWIRKVRSLAVTLRKTPVVVADRPGFLVNRILGRYLGAAAKIEASEDAVDAGAREFGFPMGPFEVLDIVGHGVAQAVCKQLHDAFGDRFAAETRFRKGKRRNTRPADITPALLELRDEAERCASEGIADPAHIDLACAMGFGYPAWRGPILLDVPQRARKAG